MNCKALVVEHEAEAIEAIGEVLESLGHRFDVAYSQAEALQRVGEHRYSYIVSGIEIPARSRNGAPRIQNVENMLDRLGEMVGGTCPPIIIMTDHKAPETLPLVEAMRLAVNLRDKGATEFIAKPFPAAGRTLDRVIKKVLAGKVNRGNITWPRPVPVEPPPAQPVPATAPAKAEAGQEKWLTVTQAAKLLARDLPSLDIRKARSRISTAASRGEFKTTGSRRSRRVEPVSFDAWRLKQRDRDLDEEDVA